MKSGNDESSNNHSAILHVEIIAERKFWQDAVRVEWAHQYPQRPLKVDGANRFVIAAAWLEDLTRVAGECFARVVVAPPDAERRRILTRLFTRG